MCIEAVHIEPQSLACVPDRFKTQEVCNEAVPIYPYLLGYVPRHLKTQDTCNEVMKINPASFFLIPDHFKTQEMCIEEVKVDPWQLHHVSDHFRIHEMCNKAVRKDPSFLKYVLDWFVTERQVKIWNHDNDYCSDNELINWYDGYKKRKAQKAKIKEELMPTAWHPSRWQNWCFPEDETKQTEKLR